MKLNSEYVNKLAVTLANNLEGMGYINSADWQQVVALLKFDIYNHFMPKNIDWEAVEQAFAQLKAHRKSLGIHCCMDGDYKDH